jgi:hypothetical protein
MFSHEDVNSEVKVRKNFTDFILVQDQTGQGLSDFLIVLDGFGIHIND